MGSGMEKVKMSWLACLLLLVARGVLAGRDLEEKWEVDEGEGDGIELGGPGEGFGGPGFGGGIGGPGTGDGGGYGGDCRGGGGDGGNGYGGGDGGTDRFGWPGTGDGGYGGHNYNEVMHQMKFDHQGKAGAAAALNNESP